MLSSHLINANIHRAKEGARVLEDIARFVLRDEILMHQCREIRHRIQILSPIYNSQEDLGASVIEDNVRVNLIHIIQANSLRLQEALRVLEEMTQDATEKHLMKELRYQAYDLHAKLYFSAKKYLKLHLLEGLYLIIDTEIISRPIEQIIEIINQSPVNIVQYRNKLSSKKIFFDKAYKLKKQLDSHKLLIINDHLDIALDLGDGIHLGQNDYPLERIRNIIPDDFIYGISCHNEEEAYHAVQCDASYITVGCLFKTKSKSDAIPVSIQELQKICKKISLPVCAIGGINTNNLEQILTADIKMAAVISSVWEMNNPLHAIIEMHEKLIKSPHYT